jgi:ABC-type Fe3+-hydroxamate transport system substrate-binding protein
MKKTITLMMTLLMIFAMTLGMSACKGPSDKEEDAKQEPAATDTEKVVASITDIDTEDMKDLPLEIESVTLLEGGSVRIVPTGDLKKNEIKDDKTDAIYPFDEFGKVKDIYLVRFGNGGYRTVIALMDDGTLSALSAKELIEDHIAVVMPNVSGRDNYVSVEEKKDEDGFMVIGRTDDGEEIELDFSLNF